MRMTITFMPSDLLVREAREAVPVEVA